MMLLSSHTTTLAFIPLVVSPTNQHTRLLSSTFLTSRRTVIAVPRTLTRPTPNNNNYYYYISSCGTINVPRSPTNSSTNPPPSSRLSTHVRSIIYPVPVPSHHPQRTSVPSPNHPHSSALSNSTSATYTLSTLLKSLRLSNILRIGPKVILATTLLVAALVTAHPLPTTAALPSKPPITNSQILLLNALPAKQSAFLNDLQFALQDLTTEGGANIRSSGIDVQATKGIKSWPAFEKSQTRIKTLLADAQKVDQLIQAIPTRYQDSAKAIVQDMSQIVDQSLPKAIEKKQTAKAVQAQIKLLEDIDKLGTMLAVDKAYPALPVEAKDFNSFIGRASLAVTFQSTKTGAIRVIHFEVDGFTSPISAKRFLDLVNDGTFKDNASIKTVDDTYALVTPQQPKKSLSNLPLEIKTQGNDVPYYGESLESMGLFKEKPVLPFSSFGVVALGHKDDDVNSGNGSQFFFVKTDPASTPAGLNILDGNFTVLGYAIENRELINELDVGDRVTDIQVDWLISK